MARRSGLGKGLGALIPGEQAAEGNGDADAPEGLELLELPLDAIRPNAFQPRVHFDEASLTELAASIAEVGVLQPVLVRHIAGEEGEFELVAGERRWRSARRAGLASIPAIVQDKSSDVHALEVALIENLHRTDLNPLEEAAAYQQLIDEFALTHEQVAARVSRNRVTITNTLRLLQLPPAVQGAIAEGRLTAGHARALLPLGDPAAIEATAAKVEAEGLSVRATEQLVRRLTAPASAVGVEQPAEPAGPREPPLPDAGISELEHLLERHLETRVRVELLKGKKGKVIVEFADLDDLERIYRAVTGVASPT
jgi:ParB family transcriptional regulator, chromosome partitioning protein